MSNSAYHIVISVISLIILLSVLLHVMDLGELEDRGSKLYKKLLLLSMLDIFFDLISIVVPLIPGLHMPWLFNILNGVYFQLNVYMLYTMYFYVFNLRDAGKDAGRPIKTLAAVPGAISAVLLVANLFIHNVFWYDDANIYHHGPLYDFIYMLAFLYLVATVVSVLIHKAEYSAWKRVFLLRVFVTLLACITFQLFYPAYLTIDLGIALSVLFLYLHINNPVRYVDFVTSALDKSYFDIWGDEQIQQENTIFLTAVSAINLNEIRVMQGDKTADACLAALARELREFDHEHSVFRLSGNCFLVHNHDMAHYEARLKELVDWCKSEKCQKLLPGCSLRVAGIPNAEELIKEHAIRGYINYLNRQAGANGSEYIVSSDEYLRGFRYDMEIERYVREAVEKDLFELAFQPIYHLKAHAFNSVEVLTRLQHPAFGRLNPQRVINIAEQNGLIDELTRLQIRRLCAFLQENPTMAEKIDRFKFNLSPSSILNSDFIRTLIGEIEEFELPTQKFEFEITESTATELSAELMNVIEILKEHDIYLTLDDFGSGYSNLSNVLQIPFHSIKLDRSLILQVGKNSAVAKFYEGIVHIMQEYGLEIVCEGVETKQETDLLNSWGADMIQGFYYSKPLPQEQFVSFVAGM